MDQKAVGRYDKGAAMEAAPKVRQARAVLVWRAGLVHHRRRSVLSFAVS
jgi:hypothetical protein